MPCSLSSLLDSVVLGDNCETLAAMPPESVDLVVTSPPYDDLRTYGGHSWDFYGVAWLLKRVLKPGGVIVWVVNDQTKDGSETGTSMEQALHFRRIGMRLHDTMVYETAKPPMNDKRYQAAWEYMFVFTKDAPRVWNPIKERSKYAGTKTGATYREADGGLKPRHGGREIGEMKVRENIWRYRSGFGADDTTAHPAAFPLALAKDHVATWTEPGDVVLDPFAGSGTTLKAAKELGRRFVGIEINPEYVEICNRRIAQEVLNLFPANKEAH